MSLEGPKLDGGEEAMPSEAVLKEIARKAIERREELKRRRKKSGPGNVDYIIRDLLVGYPDISPADYNAVIPEIRKFLKSESEEPKPAKKYWMDDYEQYS